MAEMKNMITVSGINVQVIRKKIKNLHLAICPPEGHVRVSVPMHITDDSVRLAVVSKLRWIKNKQLVFDNQPRQSKRNYISGECHYVFGNRCRLELIECKSKPRIKLLKSSKLIMYTRPGAIIEVKERLLNEWYRSQLKSLIPELLDKWQPIVGKSAKSWGVKKMKTKWGSCNITEHRIWLNLELAKKPIHCLEYVLVHELVHLHERLHNENFHRLMKHFYPNWKQTRALLNKEPLSNENWQY